MESFFVLLPQTITFGLGASSAGALSESFWTTLLNMITFTTPAFNHPLSRKASPFIRVPPSATRSFNSLPNTITFHNPANPHLALPELITIRLIPSRKPSPLTPVLTHLIAR